MSVLKKIEKLNGKCEDFITIIDEYSPLLIVIVVFLIFLILGYSLLFS